MNSTSTRFRVQTAAPLELIKAWHAISTESDIRLIEDLRNELIQTLEITKVDGEVVLELDGFALLPSSPVGVVRDGDIITIRCKPRIEKRKATEAVDQTTKKRKTQSPTSSPTVTPPAPPMAMLSKSPARPSSLAGTTKPVDSPTKPPQSSSEDDSSTDSDSSSDDSESSSDSSSESTTDSESDSSSDSDSNAGPTPRPISRQPVASARQTSVSQVSIVVAPPARTPSQPPVPPGYGKQTTKNRNARRRALRKHVAAGTTLSPRVTPTPVPAMATPTPAPAIEPMTTTLVKATAPIAPAKQANKNKRKGFDKDMAEAVSSRITFGTPTTTPTPAEPPSRPSSTVPAQTKSRYTHYHVVPPSQLKDLPSNVVVTSVDVEVVDGLEGVGEWFDGADRATEEHTSANETSQPEAKDPNKKINWEVVDSEWEQLWDSFPVIGKAVWDNLQVGALLAYKGLTLDPVTCTPCTKIHIARVISGSSDGGEMECFFIDRPGAGDIGFGFGGKFGTTSEEPENTQDEELGESRKVAFAEVGEWKIVS